MTVVNIAKCPVHGLHGCRDVCFAFEHEGRGDCDGIVEQVPMVPLAEYEAVVMERDAAREAFDTLTRVSAAYAERRA